MSARDTAPITTEGFITRLSGAPPGLRRVSPISRRFCITPARWRAAPTNILTLANGLTAIPSGKTITNTAAYDPNYKIPYAQTWNLGIQRNLPNQLVLQINYTGIKGTHMVIGLDPNEALPGPPATAAQRLPITNASIFTYYETGGNLISNSGQVSLHRRMRNNLGFQLSYTRAKSIDDASTQVLNPMCIECERALSTNDIRDRVTFTFTAESPVDQRKGFLANKGFLTKALKNWTLQAPITWETGLPLTATVNGDVSGVGTRKRGASRGHGASHQFRHGLLQHGGIRGSGIGNLRQRGPRHHSGAGSVHA